MVVQPGITEIRNINPAVYTGKRELISIRCFI